MSDKRALANYAGSTQELANGDTVYNTVSSRALLGNWGVPIGAGTALNGSALDKGGNWVVSGPGAATTVRNAGGYAVDPSGTNAYLFVQAAGKVRRYVQRWSGTTGSFPTSAISTSSSSLDNMLHVNFSSGGLADIKKWVAGTGNLGLTFGGPVRNCPTLDNGAQGDVTLELIDDKIFAYVGGLLVAWGQDAQIATWGASLNVAVGQLHNANEKIYGMWTYDEQAERSDLGNTFPIAEGLRNGAPIQTGTLMVAPGGTTQLADFDVVARENRDQVFRSAFAVTQHYKAGTGYGVRQYFGNGGYDAASPGDTYAEWSTSMLGFRFVVGGGTRGTFPHPAFNYGDAVFPSITIGAEASTTPRIVSAANLAGLATVPDGSLGMTADGKFAQRVSGAWVEKGTGGGGGGVVGEYPVAVSGTGTQSIGYVPPGGFMNMLADQTLTSGAETDLEWDGPGETYEFSVDGDNVGIAYTPSVGGITSAVFEITVAFHAQITAGSGTVVLRLYKNGVLDQILHNTGVSVTLPSFSASHSLRIDSADTYKVTATLTSASGSRTMYAASQICFKYLGSPF